MTPDQRRLAREVVESALFDTLERRAECLRQTRELPDQAVALRGEAARLTGRINELEGLHEALNLEGRMTATEALAGAGSSPWVDEAAPLPPDIFS